jgi:hypothetical protein
VLSLLKASGHHLTAQVGASPDGRPRGTKRSLTESRLSVCLRRARLTPGEAEEWAAAGSGPYEATAYRSAGLTVQVAIRCWRAASAGRSSPAGTLASFWPG